MTLWGWLSIWIIHFGWEHLFGIRRKLSWIKAKQYASLASFKWEMSEQKLYIRKQHFQQPTLCWERWNTQLTDDKRLQKNVLSDCFWQLQFIYSYLGKIYRNCGFRSIQQNKHSTLCLNVIDAGNCAFSFVNCLFGMRQAMRCRYTCIYCLVIIIFIICIADIMTYIKFWHRFMKLNGSNSMPIMESSR